jgi:hypothetical protein
MCCDDEDRSGLPLEEAEGGPLLLQLVGAVLPCREESSLFK